MTNMRAAKIGTIGIILIVVIGCYTIIDINMGNTQTKFEDIEATFTEVKKEENTELISKKDVKDTPFTIVSLNDKNEHFAVMGEFRITEKYDDPRKVENEVKRMTWNRVIQVMMIVQEKLKDQELTKELKKK